MSINFQSNFISGCNCFSSDYKRRSFSQGMAIKNSKQQKLLGKVSREGTESSGQQKLRIARGEEKMHKKSLRKQQPKQYDYHDDQKSQRDAKNNVENLQIRIDRPEYISKEIGKAERYQNNFNKKNENYNIMNQSNSKYPEDMKAASNQILSLHPSAKSHQDHIFLNQVHDIIPINPNKSNTHLFMAYQNPQKNQQQNNITFHHIIGQQINRPLLKKSYQREMMRKIPEQTNQSCNPSENHYIKQEIKPTEGQKSIRQNRTDNSVSFGSPLSFSPTHADILPVNSSHSKKSNFPSPSEKEFIADDSTKKNSSTQNKMRKKISITKQSPNCHKNGKGILRPKQIQSVFDSQDQKSDVFSEVIHRQEFLSPPFQQIIGFQLQSLIKRGQVDNNQFRLMKGTMATQTETKF